MNQGVPGSTPPDSGEAAAAPPQEGGVFARRSATPRSWRAFGFKVAVSAALIAVILWHAKLDTVLATISRADLRWAALGLAAQFTGAAVIARRWQGLLAARGVAASWHYLYASTVISNFFRQFLPSILGGDVIRGYDAWRAGASVGLAFMSLLLDRLTGLLALVLFAASVLVAFPGITDVLPSSGVYIAAALIALGAIVLVLSQLVLPSRRLLTLVGLGLTRVPRAIRPKLDKIAAALGTYRDAPGVLGRALAWSLLLQANVITFYWMLAVALDLDVAYVVFYLIVPIAFIVMLLPVTVNGIGLREGMFVFLLAPWGVDAAQAVAFAWLEYGTTLVFGVIAGLVYMLRTR